MAREFYVDSLMGDDSLSGINPANAWKSLEKINKEVFEAGDRILLAAGRTFYGSLRLCCSGYEGKPITLESYGNGRAIINADSGTGVYWENSSYIVVRNLEIVGCGQNNRGTGLVIENTLGRGVRLHNVIVEKVIAHGFSFEGKGDVKPDCFSNGCGIYVGGSSEDNELCGFEGVKIDECKAFNNQLCGITVSGTLNNMEYSNKKVLISRCTAHNNTGNADYTENWSGSGIFINGCEDGIIERCIAYRNGKQNPASAPGGPVGIWTHCSKGIIIQFNESYENQSSGLDGGGFDFDGGVRDSVIQYNYSHDNRGAGVLIYSYDGAPDDSENLTVRYNISENDGINTEYGSIFIRTDGPSMKDIKIYNNTFYHDRAKDRKCITGSGAGKLSKVLLANNIFISEGNKLIDIAENVNKQIFFVNNAYSCSGQSAIYENGKDYSKIEQWRRDTGQETLDGEPRGIEFVGAAEVINPGRGGTFQDTLLMQAMKAYKLLPNSTLMQAGLDLMTHFGIDGGNTDFFGNIIDKHKPKVGA